MGFNYIICWFLHHNLQITNTRKPIKGSKDADFHLVFVWKKLKAPSCGWGQGPDDASHKSLYLPLMWCHPPKAQIQNFPIFLIENTRLSASADSFNSSLAQSTAKLRLAQLGKILSGLNKVISNFRFPENDKFISINTRKHWHKKYNVCLVG